MQLSMNFDITGVPIVWIFSIYQRIIEEKADYDLQKKEGGRK
jgi:hypothetical protein